MTTPGWGQRFFESTRGQILVLLRRARRTVDELATALGLTDNAVRAHLVSLERDGLVQQHGVRRTEYKPAQLYQLTEGGEQLFPKAHGRVLHQLLDVLAEDLSPAELEALLRRVGARLAAAEAPARGDPVERAARGVAVLGELGGLAELEFSPAVGPAAGEGRLVIHGYRCPLAALLPGHPEVCRLAEALLADLLGQPVVERCQRNGDAPRCRFEVALS